MTHNDVIIDRQIYKAALRDDWDSVEQIFKDHPDKMTNKIGGSLDPPIIVAVGTNRSHRFVKQLVEHIVEAGKADEMWVCRFNNPLHVAAKVGNTIDARILVEQNPEMPQVANPMGNTALKLAAWHGHKDTLRYLLEVTRDLSPGGEEGTSPYTGKAGGDLITLTITAAFYDVALEIVERYPNIVTELDRKGEMALQVLATKPEVFPSGMRLGFLSRLTYSMIPVKASPRAKVNSSMATIPYFQDLHKVWCHLNAGFLSALQYIAPSIRNIHDKKLACIHADQLLKHVCKTIMERLDHNLSWNAFGMAITTAVKYGIYELIEECLLAYPFLLCYTTNRFYLFIEAIKERQERVYNLRFQLSGHKVYAITEVATEDKENALHIAAKLAPSHRLNTVTGAALQMQRELQWFKEVQQFIEPSFKEALNNKGKTPRMVFTDEHKKLLKEGEEWMKTTASSCTVVAALIVTMAFAAAFTAPGGNENDGKPVYLNERSFMLFVISDAVALFSSATSVLMFLGILTSRYAEDDFLYSLPKRMMIGLLSLFLSLAAAMIAFSATLALVLHDKITWIAVPLTLVTAVPVTSFAYMQFPLLVELVNSTWGPSIFHKQNDELIH